MSESVRHECPQCGSSRGLALYQDGHGHCFSCETTFTAKRLAAAGFDVNEVDLTETETKTSKGHIAFPLHGEPAALPKRRLTQETTQKWRYRLVEHGGRVLQSADIHDENGRRVAQKLRWPDKTFTWLGDRETAEPLYGMWLWKSGGKKVVITEGEIDAMTVSQLQDHKWPVVSLPDGAGSAAKAIKKAMPWLQGFEQVVLMFDNDEVGQKAIEKVVGLFPPGKVAVARLPLKDPSDMLQAGRGSEVISAIWNAKEWRPDSIQNAADLWDEFINGDDDAGVPWPWAGLNAKLLGLRKRELVVFTAGSGIGKSTAVRETAHHLLKLGYRVGYIALEESNRKTLRELVSIELNKRLVRAPKEGEGAVPPEELKAAFDSVVGGGNLYLYNHFGSLNSERLLNHIRFLAVSLGVDFVFLDHLSIVVSGDDTITDERRSIDVTMTKLRSLVEETGLGLILVSHLKRPEGKGHEEGAATSLAQLRGSAAIAQLADAVVGMERNQQDPLNAHRTTLRVLKNRYVGETGPACSLVYDEETGRLSEETLFEDVSEDDETDDRGGVTDY